MAREPLDRDYIEIGDGTLLTVVGYLHPPGRVICYPKYAPTRERTPWRRGDTHYARLPATYGAGPVYETISEALRRYMVRDEVLGVEVIEIPADDVIRHYAPEARLSEIVEGPRDELERDAAELALLISDCARISLGSLGVTGSLLPAIHNPRISDIDLVVYGFGACRLVKRILSDEDARRSLGIGRPGSGLLTQLINEAVAVHPLTKKEAEAIYRARWSRGVFRGRFFSVHPVLRADEAPERYGDRLYKGLSLVDIVAVVANASLSEFNPATYVIEDAEVLRGAPRDIEVREVCSYEGLFAGLAEEGERIFVRGKLERVRDRRRGREYYRVVVGTREYCGLEFIKPERWVREGITPRQNIFPKL